MQEQEHLPARRPAPPGQSARVQVRPSLEAVLAAVPGSRPADPPAPSKHHQIITLITLAPAVWVMFSPMIVGYPFDAVGNTAVAWSQNVGIVVAVAAAARAYQPAVTRRAAVVLLAGSVTLVAAAFFGGFRTSAPVVWWDLLLTGSALTVLSLIGLVLLRRERRR